MEQQFMDQVCSGCLHHWDVRPTTGEPGLKRPTVLVCQYMRSLGLNQIQTREYVAKYTALPETPDAVKIEKLEKNGIPCSALTECPNQVKVDKYKQAMKFVRV